MSESSKSDILERIVKIMSSEIAAKTLREADRRLKGYLTDVVQRIIRRLLVMAAGGIIALIGAIFLFVAFSEYINEMMNSAWMGWGIGGLVAMVIGLLTYALSRR